MKKLLSILALGFLATAVNAAAVDLRVTEVFSGPGAATLDWFEVTNFGDFAYDMNDEPLYYDDESVDPAGSVALSGINTIAPGESVIFLIDTKISDGEIQTFLDVWGENVNNVQIGKATNGSGLSDGNGDKVALFFANALGTQPFTIVSFGPSTATNFVSDGEGNWGSLAAIGVLGGYESNVYDGASATLIGSPGMVVPEPATLSLLTAAGLSMLRRRK